MLDFLEVKRNKRDFLALTGLTLKEFKLILPHFRRTYEKQYEGTQTQAGKLRQRKTGGGRSSVLDRIEQKLLFILVYQKTYPVQVVTAKLFDMSQPRANQWIHRLLPVLKDALDELGAWVISPRLSLKQCGASSSLNFSLSTCSFLSNVRGALQVSVEVSSGNPVPSNRIARVNRHLNLGDHVFAR